MHIRVLRVGVCALIKTVAADASVLTKAMETNPRSKNSEEKNTIIKTGAGKKAGGKRKKKERKKERPKSSKNNICPLPCGPYVSNGAV